MSTNDHFFSILRKSRRFEFITLFHFKQHLYKETKLSHTYVKFVQNDGMDKSSSIFVNFKNVHEFYINSYTFYLYKMFMIFILIRIIFIYYLYNTLAHIAIIA